MLLQKGFKLKDFVDLYQMSLLSLVTCCIMFSLLVDLITVICLKGLRITLKQNHLAPSLYVYLSQLAVDSVECFLNLRILHFTHYVEVQSLD